MGYLTAVMIILSMFVMFFINSTNAIYQKLSIKAVDTANQIVVGWTPAVQQNYPGTVGVPFRPNHCNPISGSYQHPPIPVPVIPDNRNPNPDIFMP